MKEGLRKQFFSTLALEEIEYFGNIMVGAHGHINLQDLRLLGMDAILVATGAQGTKWLGIPGEDFERVYHAKDLVYHYNQLPPFSTRKYEIGKRVAIIGVGNVMMDIARYLICDRKVEMVTAIARRGPAELKFSRRELEYVAHNLDLENFRQEIERVKPLMDSLGQDVDQVYQFITDAQRNGDETCSDTILRLRFLASPKCILGDENNQVCGLELEENTLMEENGAIRPKGLGIRTFLDVDTVIFAIGDTVDPGFGLPVDRYEFIKNPLPRFPIDDTSYESFNPLTGEVIADIFLAGWARKASEGLVGVARKDGVNAAHAILSYLGDFATTR